MMTIKIKIMSRSQRKSEAQKLVEESSYDWKMENQRKVSWSCIMEAVGSGCAVLTRRAARTLVESVSVEEPEASSLPLTLTLADGSIDMDAAPVPVTTPIATATPQTPTPILRRQSGQKRLRRSSTVSREPRTHNKVTRFTSTDTDLFIPVQAENPASENAEINFGNNIGAGSQPSVTNAFLAVASAAVSYIATAFRFAQPAPSPSIPTATDSRR